MDSAILWFVLAVFFIVLELFVGSFYLCILGIICAAIGSMHIAFFSLPVLVTVVPIYITCVFVFFKKTCLKKDTSAYRDNADMRLDIGRIVYVKDWQDNGEIYMAQVNYRGSVWQVEMFSNVKPAPGSFKVIDLVSNRLIVQPVKD